MPTPNKVLLKLYITGHTPRSKRAIQNLHEICAQMPEDTYLIQIIDVLDRPQLAEDEKILATPTLIKQVPLPLRRVIGDLAEKEKILLGLDIRLNAKNSESKEKKP